MPTFGNEVQSLRMLGIVHQYWFFAASRFCVSRITPHSFDNAAPPIAHLIQKSRHDARVFP
jgi:hypothetical protein